jgi:hypothetical protein
MDWCAAFACSLNNINRVAGNITLLLLFLLVLLLLALVRRVLSAAGVLLRAAWRCTLLTLAA